MLCTSLVKQFDLSPSHYACRASAKIAKMVFQLTSPTMPQGNRYDSNDSILAAKNKTRRYGCRVQLTGKEHDQAVDADAETGRGGHAALQGIQEVLVDVTSFFVSRRLNVQVQL